jgi:hypothetical protein
MESARQRHGQVARCILNRTLEPKLSVPVQSLRDDSELIAQGETIRECQCSLRSGFGHR